jgi:uncharacterized RDD family membrane protein YckC
MQEFHQALFLLLQLIAGWSMAVIVGLIPPVVFRYIYKSAISEKHALFISIAYWILNIFVFTVIAGKRGIHEPFTCLVAYFCYQILTRGTGNKNATDELSQNTRFAGFWARFRAHFIDIIAMFVAVELIWTLTDIIESITLSFLLNKRLINDSNPKHLSNVRYWSMAFVVGWTYFSALPSSAWRATFGQKLWCLKITNRHGNRVSFSRATVKYFAEFLYVLIFYFVLSNSLGSNRIIFLIFLLLFLVGYATVLWTGRKRSLFDMIAGTQVINTDKL